METDATDFKRKIESLNLDVQKGNNIITSLKKDIEGLKKEIQERDDTIQDKVNLIYLIYLMKLKTKSQPINRKKEFMI
jgi:cilia- and flagella-associated protein 57